MYQGSQYRMKLNQDIRCMGIDIFYIQLQLG